MRDKFARFTHALVMANTPRHSCGSVLDPHCATESCLWWRCPKCKRTVKIDDLGRVQNEIVSK